MKELWCYICLYVRPKPGLDDDAKVELELLTVVEGMMVCLRHAPFAGNHFESLKHGVAFESDGKFTSLSAYQDWRGKQDEG